MSTSNVRGTAVDPAKLLRTEMENITLAEESRDNYVEFESSDFIVRSKNGYRSKCAICSKVLALGNVQKLL